MKDFTRTEAAFAVLRKAALDEYSLATQGDLPAQRKYETTMALYEVLYGIAFNVHTIAGKNS